MKAPQPPLKIEQNQVALACSVSVIDFMVNGPKGQGGPLAPSQTPDKQLRNKLKKLGDAARGMLQHYRYKFNFIEGQAFVDEMQDISLERLEILSQLAQVIWTGDAEYIERIVDFMEESANELYDGSNKN